MVGINLVKEDGLKLQARVWVGVEELTGVVEWKRSSG